MDTKLKNRHKLAVVLILLMIAIPTMAVLSGYRGYSQESEELQNALDEAAFCSSDFMEEFVWASYILYSTESDAGMSKIEKEQELEYLFQEEMQMFDALYPYLEYSVEDENGELVAESVVDSGKKSLSSYGLAMTIRYDENGIPEAKIQAGEHKTGQIRELRSVLNGFSRRVQERYQYSDGENQDVYMKTPKNRTFTFAMTESNLKAYMDNWHYASYTVSERTSGIIIMLLCVTAAAALLLPFFSTLHTGGERIFRCPVEIVVAAAFFGYIILFDNLWYLFSRNQGRVEAVDVLVWAGVFAGTYWVAANVRHLFTMGLKGYLKEYSLIVRSSGKIRKGVRWMIERCKAGVDKVYHSFDHIDLDDKNNKFILKLVLVNFVILVCICSIWFFGIIALVIYSVILYLILRKYFNDLKAKYAVLLKATNQMAEGNLDVEITEPKGSQEELAKVKDVLGQGVTDYSASSAARATNVKNGTSKLNGKVLYPGEEISVCDNMVPFTEENGYAPAASYANGTVVESFGGGICQVSTTLYQAVLQAELEVTERHNHSMIVKYVEPSMDAAIAEGAKDFRFVNNTEAPIYIEGYTYGGKIYFNLYGEEYRSADRKVTYESETLETIDPTTELTADPEKAFGSMEQIQSAHTGYKAKLWKIVTENGEQVSKEEVNNSYYQMTPNKYKVGVKTSNAEASSAMYTAIANNDLNQVYVVLNQYGG